MVPSVEGDEGGREWAELVVEWAELVGEWVESVVMLIV